MDNHKYEPHYSTFCSIVLLKHFLHFRSFGGYTNEGKEDEIAINREAPAE